MESASNASGSTGYGVAVVEQMPDGIDMNFVLHLDEEEASSYADALSDIRQLFHREVFDLLERNYEHLISTVHYFETLFSGRREEGRIESRSAAFGVMAGIINWLSTSRIFLDHEITRLKRTYGGQSDEAKEFIRATNVAYDSSSSYRILYRFRNYVVHCGLPLGSVSVHLPAGARYDPDGPLQIAFLLDRDHLLSDFEWAKVAEDLQRMPPQFSVVDLIRDAMPHFRELMKCGTGIDLRRAKRSAASIENLIERTGAAEDQDIALVQITPKNGGGYFISPLPIPAQMVRQLATSDEASFSWIFEHERLEDAATLDSGTAYRLKRGAAVVASWLESGGGSVGFFETINRLVNEDEGNPEPVITGVLNVAASSLNTAALVLNTPVESILARIANGNVRRD
jgi:hypothetical protein